MDVQRVETNGCSQNASVNHNNDNSQENVPNFKNVQQQIRGQVNYQNDSASAETIAATPLISTEATAKMSSVPVPTTHNNDKPLNNKKSEVKGTKKTVTGTKNQRRMTRRSPNTVTNALTINHKNEQCTPLPVAHKSSPDTALNQTASYTMLSAALTKPGKNVPKAVNNLQPSTSTSNQISAPVENTTKGKRRKLNQTNKSPLKNDIDEPRVSKRVRLQYQPFQSPESMVITPTFYRSTPPSKNPEDKIVVFNRGDFLAVRNESGSFYVCRTAQNVYKTSKKFKIQWLSDDKDPSIYIPDFYDQTDFECVLTNLRMIRCDKGKYKLPGDEKQRVLNILTRALNVERGVSEMPDPRQVAMDGVDVSVVGKAEEQELIKISPKIEVKSETSKHKTVGRPKKKQKEKSASDSDSSYKAAKIHKKSSRKVPSNTSPNSTPADRRTTRSSSTKSSNVIKSVLKSASKSKRVGIDSVVKKLRSKARSGNQSKATLENSVKTPRAVHQKKKKPSTNGKASISLNVIRKQKLIAPLQPKPQITQYERDPLFEGKQFSDFPFISSLAESKLLIRAVILKDYDLLERLMTEEKVCSFCVNRCLALRRDALSLAVEREDLKAIKMLMDPKYGERFAPFPHIITVGDAVTSSNSSVFSYSSKNNSNRGRLEITNALLKDMDTDYRSPRQKTSFTTELIKESLQAGISKESLQKMIAIQPEKYEATFTLVLNNIVTALHSGHRKLAGNLIDMAIIKGGFGFNNLHKEALLSDGEPFSAFKPSSVRKKAHLNSRVTPIHCAALNPNSYYLSTLLQSQPDYSLQDNDGWQPIHYAAVCEGTSPLEYLISKGISTLQTDKEGNTPLHLACLTSAAHNVELILSHEAKSCNDEHGTSCIEKQNKAGLTPLHVAVERGSIEIARILLQSGADAEKQTTASNDRLTPLMIAAQFGHIHILKMLIDRGVDVEATDKKHRTALLHAVMNGHSNIVSYLLRLGVNPDVKDNVGNTAMHYAAAYGWYFCFKILAESGAKLNESNDGKVTPVLVAFLKGHMGLAELIAQQGIDVNSHFEDANGITLLMETVMSKPGDLLLARLEFLVESQNADCKKVDFDGNNALHYLVKSEVSNNNFWNSFSEENVEKNHKHSLYEASRILIEHGCDPKAVNKRGESAFSLAAKHGCFSLMRKFLETGCRINMSVNDNGNTILHLIVSHILQDEASEFLRIVSKENSAISVLKEMAKVYNSEGKTPLLASLFRFKYWTKEEYSEKKKFVDFVRYLIEILESDVEACIKDADRDSCLHVAARHCSSDVLALITKKFSNINVLNSKQRTPLMEALIYHNEEAAKFLINIGADVNFRSESVGNKTILLLAASSQLAALIPLMVSKGAKVNETDDESGNTALQYVAMSPQATNALDAVKALVVNGTDVNAKNKDDRTALHLVLNARQGETDVSYEIEEFLIESGAKLDIKDCLGRLPLHYAFVKIGQEEDSSFVDPVELVVLLTSNKVDAAVNVSDQYQQQTPLHRAAIRGATISCMHLIQKVSNMDALDINNNSALGLAVLYGHESCALMLLQKGANFTLSLNTSPLRLKKTEEWETHKKETENDGGKLTILQEVIVKDWQGLLYLMLDQLENLGKGVYSAIEAAVCAQRLKLAYKLIKRLKPSKSVAAERQTFVTTIARHLSSSEDKQLQRDIIHLLQSKNVDINLNSLEDMKP